MGCWVLLLWCVVVMLWYAGDWRFLDLVPIKAGKLEALDYVRKTHSFSHAATVACGDSGNDILMLSGKNLAIVVGNAQPDLVKWLEKHKQVCAAEDCWWFGTLLREVGACPGSPSLLEIVGVVIKRKS